MYLKFLLLSTLLLSLNSFAGTLHCSSAEAHFKYSYVQSDGGAPIDPSTSLILDNTVLISDEPFSDTKIRLAQFELSGKPSLVQITKKNYYQTKIFVQPALVKLIENNSILFSEKVFCKEVTYYGPPRP